jgi:CheY-like chemotaxis protein
MSKKKPILCLLIDDDQEESEILNFAAEELSEPVKCLRADNGREALDGLRAGKYCPDYIFLDLYMPRMDGVECLSRLKRLPQLGQVPVIVYSASLPESHREELRRLGADGFIEKTSNIPDLVKQLQSFFVSHPTFPETTTV